MKRATPTAGPIATAEQAGAWLEGLIDHERMPGFRYARLDLTAITALLERLGHPERALSVVHVAGSKGKGSVCLLAESILRAAGERVGTFTSPHLERWTERFRIDGREVGAAELAAAAEHVRPHVEALRAAGAETAPTFFDATTALAFVLFARARVDRALIEVGLGGRLDSTNAVSPAVTVVTHIELEHTDKLGDTLAAIAGEKAGILKPGIPCVTGALAEEAARVVDDVAARVGAPVLRLGRDFSATAGASTIGGAPAATPAATPAAAPAASAAAPAAPTADVGGPRASTAEPRPVRSFDFRAPGLILDGLVLPVLGRHQVDNAAIAIAAVARLGAHDSAALADAVRAGLRGVALPGRLEVLSSRPTVVVDAAHTAASARSLADVLATMPARRRHLLLSISGDKDAGAILAALAPVVDEVWLTRADPIRSCALDRLEALASEHLPGATRHAIESPREAARAARAALGEDDLLCCAGSVYLAGAARSVLRERTAAAST